MPDGSRWAVLGLGRAGLALSQALDQRQLLASVWTRSAERLHANADAFSDAVELVSGPPAVAEGADVVLVAVPDRAIKHTVIGLPAEVRAHSGRVWLHVSGALDSRLWSDIEVSGPAGSCHPLVSMQGDGHDQERLRGAFLAIDGAEQAREAAGTLARAVGGTTGVIEGKTARVAYHLAAVLASNGVYALLSAARRVSERAHLANPALLRALARLSADSANAVFDRGVRDAATGPVVRGDAETVDRHLAWLDGEAPELAPLYRALAEELLVVAEERGVRTQLLAALRHVLHR